MATRDYELRIEDETLVRFSIADGSFGESVRIRDVNDAAEARMPLGLDLAGDGMINWMAARALPRPPLMVADAGFMYAAKMSGYADAYDLFTPDMGELAFLADEQAPHPFYTRGFLLAEEDDAPALLARAQAHGNCPANLLIKGARDLIVCGGRVVHTVSRPCVPAMECIGGTGDMVTGLATAFLVKGFSVEQACLTAARLARLLAKAHDPDPGTTVGQLLESLPQVLCDCEKDLACLE